MFGINEGVLYVWGMETHKENPQAKHTADNEMTDAQMKFEMEEAERLFGGNKNAGLLVETKSGIIGRTYSYDSLINGKTRVYTEKGNILCDPKSLKIKGFID